MSASFDNKGLKAVMSRTFRAMRREAGHNQALVAEKMGTAQSAIARHEDPKDSRLPNPVTVVSFAEACGYETTFIFRPRDGGSPIEYKAPDGFAPGRSAVRKNKRTKNFET